MSIRMQNSRKMKECERQIRYSWCCTNHIADAFCCWYYFFSSLVIKHTYIHSCMKYHNDVVSAWIYQSFNFDFGLLVCCRTYFFVFLLLWISYRLCCVVLHHQHHHAFMILVWLCDCFVRISFYFVPFLFVFQFWFKLWCNISTWKPYQKHVNHLICLMSTRHAGICSIIPFFLFLSSFVPNEILFVVIPCIVFNNSNAEYKHQQPYMIHQFRWFIWPNTPYSVHTTTNQPMDRPTDRHIHTHTAYIIYTADVLTRCQSWAKSCWLFFLSWSRWFTSIHRHCTASK